MMKEHNHKQQENNVDNSKSLNPNQEPAEETVMIIGGGNPNLSPDAGKPLI